MSPHRDYIQVLLGGVLLTALLLSCLILIAVMLASCRTPRSTTTTTNTQHTDLLSTLAVQNFRLSLADTLDFYHFASDIGAHQRDSLNNFPQYLVNSQPAHRLIRHAAMSTVDTTRTDARIRQESNTREFKETTPAQPAGSFSIAFAIIAVVCFIVVLGCMFGVVTYMILKRT